MIANKQRIQTCIPGPGGPFNDIPRTFAMITG
jgi:hypothetical protein